MALSIIFNEFSSSINSVANVFIANKFNFTILSLFDVVKRYNKLNNDILYEKYLKFEKLIPNDIINNILIEYLNEFKLNSYLLIRYPKSKSQFAFFMNAIDNNQIVLNNVFFIKNTDMISWASNFNSNLNFNKDEEIKKKLAMRELIETFLSKVDKRKYFIFEILEEEKIKDF